MTRASSWMVALLLSALCVVCGWSPATADTPPAHIAAALQQSSVYVDTGIEDADAITNRIKSRLNRDDNLRIVILGSTTQASTSSTARAVSALLPSQETVLVVSNTDSFVVAPATWPSQLTADDMLVRVRSVVQNQIDLTLRFIQSVHEWQDANPKPKAPVPPEDHSTAIYSSIAGFLTGLGLIAFGFVIVRRNQRFREVSGAPRQYRKTLRKLIEYRNTFANRGISDDLTEICKDSVYFFRNASDDNALVYRHLENVIPVLATYSKVTKERRYYENPDDLLQKGEESVRELREFVYAVAKKRNRQEISNYEVNTRIVQDARNTTTL